MVEPLNGSYLLSLLRSRPFRAWSAVQAASVWNRTERSLRRAWYALLKGVFTALMDDADLYPGLWGRSWSWVWLLVPLMAGLFGGLAVLSAWSFQVRVGLPAAGPWFHVLALVTALGAMLGVTGALGPLPRLPKSQPWPIGKSARTGLAIIGPFLHPGCLLAMWVGLAAGTPWGFHSPGRGLLLIALPICSFRLSLALVALVKKTRRKGGFQLGSDPDAASAFRRLIWNLPESGLGWAGAGFVVALLMTGHMLLGFAALAYVWALVQANILRLEGPAASLVARWPATPELKLNARLSGVTQWAAKVGLAAWIALVVRCGPVAILPGALAILEAHWMGAALGLSASAAAPLEGWSLLSLQSLGMTVALGGLPSGWLLQASLSNPMAMGAQLAALALAWAMLQRSKRRVLSDWPAIQESLVEG